MPVKQNASVEKHQLPGLEHQTLAGHSDGLRGFEVWRQRIAAGAATPLHRHNCEEVIVILAGEGVCRFPGAADEPFRRDETLIIPANAVHQICNTGEEELFLLATLAMAPVAVETEHGEDMPLPWYADPAPAPQ